MAEDPKPPPDGAPDPARGRVRHLEVNDVIWLLWRAWDPGALKTLAPAWREAAEEIQARAPAPLFDDGLTDPIELLELARVVDALDDANRLIERFDEALSIGPPDDRAFNCERPHVRAAGLRRLAKLRASDELRASCRELLAACAQRLAPLWSAHPIEPQSGWRVLEEGPVDTDVLLAALDPAGRTLVSDLPRWRIPIEQALRRSQVVVAPSHLAASASAVSALADGTVVIAIEAQPSAAIVPKVLTAARATADVLTKLSIPGRLAVLGLMFAARDAEDIGVLLGISQARVSEHLTALSELGLIESGRVGRLRTHWAIPGALTAVLVRAAEPVERRISDPLSDERPDEPGET